MDGDGVQRPGFITPPPHLMPPRHDTETQTQRAPARKRELPVFLPPTAPAPAPAPESQPQWTLELPGAVCVPVTGAVLLGRNPVHFPPWEAASLLPLDDPTTSVSKTHALIESIEQGLRITDLHSTNGVAVAGASGGEHELEPGSAETVTEDAVVWLGRFELRAKRT
ncbi:MAG: FHA domain-containing protein [Microbacteriaceae bacterium]